MQVQLPVELSGQLVAGRYVDQYNDQGPVSRKSRNFSGAFRVT